jgi:hypothetical protein
MKSRLAYATLGSTACGFADDATDTGRRSDRGESDSDTEDWAAMGREGR